MAGITGMCHYAWHVEVVLSRDLKDVIEHAVYMWARAQEEEKSKCNVWHP
jgi:hypothetical protein